MKSLPKIKAIIFDLDGTLLDSIQDIAESMNLALEEAGYPTHPIEAYKDFVGNGFGGLVQKALPADKRTEKEVKRLVKKFAEKYEEHWFVETKPFIGILHLIKTCVSHKIKLAILSNKAHYFTKKMIRHYFRGAMINQGKNPFGIYSGAEEGKPLKPDPTTALELAERLKTPVENIAFVGDSPVDMETAKNAGMIAIGAAWGFSGREILEKANPDAIYDSPTELATYLNQFPIV